MQKSVLIIGGGLIGSLLSVFLARRGYAVVLAERRPDMRLNRIYAGKSINLALSDRGWRALTAVGLDQAVREVALPMPGRILHHADGTSGYQPYGKDGQAIYSVSRGGINCTLLDEAEKEPLVKIHFNLRCTQINWDKKEVRFVNDVSGETSTMKADLIFGTDGAFSAARLQQQVNTDRFEYNQHFINYGYKELTIPPGRNGGFQLDPNGLHIWPRKNYMMIALPNKDGSFTCTLFFPYEGPESFESLDSPEKVDDFFRSTFADAYPMMPTLLQDYAANPTGSLVTVKCFPWIRGDYFAMVGDAAHAIVPFFGQGMNCGFEDCFVLDSLIEKHAHQWNLILPEYQRLRKPDADAIADLAIANFIEMRDKVADPDFLLRKKIEAWFSSKHPDRWIPAYSMVTFSPQIRYSEALRRGKEQEQIMDRVMQLPDINQHYEREDVESLILSSIPNS